MPILLFQLSLAAMYSSYIKQPINEIERHIMTSTNSLMSTKATCPFWLEPNYLEIVSLHPQSHTKRL